MQKKILLLGGSFGQLPAIEEAKRRGLYTILCDYLPDNPGRDLVDEFHLVSTTDKEKILNVAKERQIDCIMAYASDPAALTEAYVADKMGLFGNSPASIELLTHKDLFRSFQKENQFHAPRFKVLTNRENPLIDELTDLLPAVVKPVDASDTKGVTLVEELGDLNNAIKQAFNYTRCGRIIIEEKVDSELARLHGDGFVADGELRFCELGDHLYTSVADPLKPSCTLFPSLKAKEQVQRVKTVVAKLISKSGFKNGPVNIEANINSRNEVHIMEIGPRNGGSNIPQTITCATGFNMVEALFDLHLNREVTISEKDITPAICFTLHSNEEGLFERLDISKDLQSFVIEKHLNVNAGDPVKPYNKPGSSLGVLIFGFDNSEQLHQHLDHFYEKVMSGLRLKKDSSNNH